MKLKMNQVKTGNGYRYGQVRHRKLEYIQEDSTTNEGRIPAKTVYSHCLQDVEGWGIEHPQGIRQESKTGRKKESLQKKDVKKKKHTEVNHMGRLHL